MTNWPAGSYRIFISYAREDARTLAVRLRDDLNAAGQDAWLDTAEINAGATWAQDIEQAIEMCDIALVLLSHASYISPNCRAEQARALRKHKRIIPVLVQADADRPLELETMNFIDFSNLVIYDAMFDDLMTAITTGVIHGANKEDTQPLTPYLPPKESTNPFKPVKVTHKRDANGFKRYLADLRGEPWLGERHWWTYFLFTYFDAHAVVDMLQTGELKPKADTMRHGSWGHTVRLNFRPRTPDLFGCEGFRPESAQPLHYVSMPIYLLFDLEAVVTLNDVRFSEGDITQNPKTFSTAAAFRDLPFHRIYHDTWFRPNEREEILNARRAQVIVPHSLPLTHLRHIWCRSSAEQATLLHLLPHSYRDQWASKITVRKDYELFHSKWVYVEQAMLSAQGALFHFNPCKVKADDACGPFNIRAEITTPDADEKEIIDLGDMMSKENLALDLSEYDLSTGYSIRLYLDDDLAYANSFTGD
jgi:hypothetical protein